MAMDADTADTAVDMEVMDEDTDTDAVALDADTDAVDADTDTVDTDADAVDIAVDMDVDMDAAFPLKLKERSSVTSLRPTWRLSRDLNDTAVALKKENIAMTRCVPGTTEVDVAAVTKHTAGYLPRRRERKRGIYVRISKRHG